MGSMRNHKYNGAVDRINAKADKIYAINGGEAGCIFAHDVFDEIPSLFFQADYVITDIPYNKSALKSYYTKADMELDKEFTDFLDRIFKVVSSIGANSFYVETGKQSLKTLQERMARLFPNVRTIESKYYNKYPCYFVIGEHNGCTVDFEDVIKDELEVIDEIISKKNGTILDFCLGQGAVSRSAYKHGKDFIGSDLNINRLAVAIEDIQLMGGRITEM